VQLTLDELPLDLQADHEEEHGQQRVVHPLAQRTQHAQRARVGVFAARHAEILRTGS